jgi:predicted GNAT superfamily acetyltransferase
MFTFEIRPAKGWEDCVQCEELQRKIWWTPDSTEVVPASLLITAHKNGGLLLGAYEGSHLVGFVFGFLGTESEGESRRLKHCSHMLAVLPGFRKLGLGYELKKKQRECLRSQNLDLATWTYDPLQAINAWLNVGRLGVIARRYVRDAYGEMQDVLNAGVPSDRFEVEWWLTSLRVLERIDGDSGPRDAPKREAQPIYQVEFDDRGLARVTAEAEFRDETCIVEFPADFNALKAIDLDLAREWRAWTRATFESAFALNYTVQDVARWSDEHIHVAYILKQNLKVE